MRRSIRLLGVALLVGLAGGVFVAPAAQAKTLSATPDTLAQTLKTAVAGDTVQLGAGNYAGNYTINAPLTMVGGKDVTMGRLGISASNVTVDGITFVGGKYDGGNAYTEAINIGGVDQAVDNLHLQNLSFRTSTYKIYLTGSAKSINGFKLTNSTFEPALEGQDILLTSSNTSSDAAKIVVSGNSFAGTTQIRGYDANRTINNLTYQNNAWTSQDGSGVMAMYNNNLTIKNNVNGSVALCGGNHHVVIDGNTIEAGGSYSVAAWLLPPQQTGENSDITISNNKLLNPGSYNIGLVGNVHGVRIADNQIIGGQYGILIQGAAGSNSDITVESGNTISGAVKYAIMLDNTSLRNGDKVVLADGNKLADNGAEFSLNALIDDQRQPSTEDQPGGKPTDQPSDEPADQPQPEQPTEPSTDQDNAEVVNNNEAGARVPNTGVSDSLSGLSGLAGLSGLMLAGAMVAQRRLASERW